MAKTKDWPRVRKGLNGAGKTMCIIDLRPHGKRKYFSSKDTALGKRKANPGMRTGPRSNLSEEKNSSLRHQPRPSPFAATKRRLIARFIVRFFGLPACAWLLHSTLRRAKCLFLANGYHAQAVISKINRVSMEMTLTRRKKRAIWISSTKDHISSSRREMKGHCRGFRYPRKTGLCFLQNFRLRFLRDCLISNV